VKSYTFKDRYHKTYAVVEIANPGADVSVTLGKNDKRKK